MPTDLKYNRVLLKLSGEAFAGQTKSGWDRDVLRRIASEIKQVADMGVEVCIVIGGGNIVRGAEFSEDGVDRATADHMGMLGTVINGLALQGVLKSKGVEADVFSAIRMTTVCEPYVRKKALAHLKKGRIVIFAGGTGNPYFTTDTAAALRASEMECDALLKGTQVDGIYDSDPQINAEAKRFEKLSYMDVLSRDLKVMDAAAVSLTRENNIPIVIFSIHKIGELPNIVQGGGYFTLVA